MGRLNDLKHDVANKQNSFSSIRLPNFLQRWLYSPFVLVLVFTLFGLIIAAYTTLAAMQNNQNTLLLAAVLALGCFAVIMMRDIEKVLVIGIFFDIAYPIDIFLQYSSELDAIKGIPGFGVSVSSILMACLCIFWIARLINRTEKLRDGLLLSIVPSVIYLVTIIISASSAQTVQYTFFEAFIIGQSILLFLYFVDTFRTEKDFKYVMTILLFVVLTQSILMIFLFITKTNIEFATLVARVDVYESRPRVGGTIGGPNSAGGFLSLMLLPILGLIFSKVERRLKVLAVITLIVGMIALITTFSRGGWLGFATFTFIFIVISIYFGWIKLNNLLLMTFPTLITLIAFWDSIFGRLTQSDTSAIDGRLPLNEIAFQMVRDNPLIGIGANNFGIAVRIYAAQLGGIWLRIVHNKYLLIWSETGTLGLLAFLGFLATSLLSGWLYVIRDQPLSPLALGIVCGLLAHMLHMFVDIFNARHQLQALWMMTGLLVAMSMMNMNELETQLNELND